MTATPHILSSHPFRRLIVLRLCTENCLVFLIQYMGLMFCVFSSQPLPFNFATGTAAAFIFMRGFTILPGIWLGTFIAYYFSSWSFSTSNMMAMLYVLQTGLLFWLSLRYISPSLVFYRFNPLLKFLLLSGLLTTLLGNDFADWLRNMNGLLSLGLAIATWDLYFPDTYLLHNISKLALAIPYTLMLGLSLFLNSAEISSLVTITILLLSTITYISIRFGWCGAIAAILLSSLAINFQVYLSFHSSFNPLLNPLFSLVILTGLMLGTYKNQAKSS